MTWTIKSKTKQSGTINDFEKNQKLISAKIDRSIVFYLKINKYFSLIPSKRNYKRDREFFWHVSIESR